jgi:hypothetical protein
MPIVPAPKSSAHPTPNLSTKPSAQPGHSIIVELTVELIGVGLVTLLAGSNPQMGKVCVIVMSGFLLGWLLANTTTLQGWLKKA